jgi:hypothetical protein
MSMPYTFENFDIYSGGMKGFTQTRFSRDRAETPNRALPQTPQFCRPFAFFIG